MAKETFPCIALGEGAKATKPYQLVLRTRLYSDTPVQLETIMTPEEYEIVSRVVRRLVEHPAMPTLMGEDSDG
jgi:hypothetical protein